MDFCSCSFLGPSEGASRSTRLWPGPLRARLVAAPAGPPPTPQDGQVGRDLWTSCWDGGFSVRPLLLIPSPAQFTAHRPPRVGTGPPGRPGPCTDLGAPPSTGSVGLEPRQQLHPCHRPFQSHCSQHLPGWSPPESVCVRGCVCACRCVCKCVRGYVCARVCVCARGCVCAGEQVCAHDGFSVAFPGRTFHGVHARSALRF